MRVRIQPYGLSKSAKVIANSLNDLGEVGRVLRLKRSGSTFRPRQNDIVVNWGSSQQRFDDRYYINSPSMTVTASDKLAAFSAMEGYASIPDYCTQKAQAKEWLSRDAEATVYCRTLTRGNSGRGIVAATSFDEVVDAPLYTLATGADEEYRVHVARISGGYQVFDQQQKKKRNLSEEERHHRVERSETIRNFDGGWVFCRNDITVPEIVRQAAIAAVKAIGLDFGGVDVGYKTSEDRPYVYEVNTACGVEGTTLTNYTKLLTTIIKERA